MWIFKLEKVCVLDRWQLVFINKTCFGSTLSSPFPFLRQEGSDVFLAVHVADSLMWWFAPEDFCVAYV